MKIARYIEGVVRRVAIIVAAAAALVSMLAAVGLLALAGGRGPVDPADALAGLTVLLVGVGAMLAALLLVLILEVRRLGRAFPQQG